MTERKVTHSTFVLERSYPAPRHRVFAAFADRAVKAKWFVGPAEWIQTSWRLDFHEGGSETQSGGPDGGPVYRFRAHYYDIVPNERIVYSYEMYTDEERISVSLTTVELADDDGGTRLTFTEQGAYLDDRDSPGQREAGTMNLLDALGAAL